MSHFADPKLSEQRQRDGIEQLLSGALRFFVYVGTDSLPVTPLSARASRLAAPSTLRGKDYVPAGR